MLVRVLLRSVWSWGVLCAGVLCAGVLSENNNSAEPLRLVGGASRCSGTVEVRVRGEWRRMGPSGVGDQQVAAAVCRDLDCGSAVLWRTQRWFSTESCVGGHT
ncbi:scavenger receptor cysteine-rich type 1 protein M130-like isoform X2 [Boleophthalmus pectinirostris]|uniref:scavenger receptor cysteine-rich type 1 protein M130-like isoform X2 n=1 Tax=Boleophthalmus pectinirostris TaxID=150288 RepID=UPI00242C6BB9|nr:scavenger receptor cysteine-rich type 1 protein M130-like isoform X2 [Boleophthalmus pectinirostris]